MNDSSSTTSVKCVKCGDTECKEGFCHNCQRCYDCMEEFNECEEYVKDTKTAPNDENEICVGCGHEAKSHNGFSCWEKKDWGYCHKYSQCECKKFREDTKEVTKK